MADRNIDSLQEKEWRLAKPPHPLVSLQGKPLDDSRLLVLLGPKNRFGSDYFQVFLQDPSDRISQQPALIGLHNQGSYPGYNWIEVSSAPSKVSFDGDEQTLDISANGMGRELFQYLADLIPSGGHLMVEYDSPERQDTARSLALGIPPMATPLGYLLFSVGCGAGFKDWYFAESGSEGPRKLQGYKALNDQHARLKNDEMIKELKAFLAKPPSEDDPDLEKAARNRARKILSALSS